MKCKKLPLFCPVILLLRANNGQTFLFLVQAVSPPCL